MDPDKYQFTTAKSSVPPSTSLAIRRIRTALGTYPLWKLRNIPEGGHTIGHHLQQWK